MCSFSKKQEVWSDQAISNMRKGKFNTKNVAKWGDSYSRFEYLVVFKTHLSHHLRYLGRRMHSNSNYYAIVISESIALISKKNVQEFKMIDIYINLSSGMGHTQQKITSIALTDKYIVYSLSEIYTHKSSTQLLSTKFSFRNIETGN